MERCSSYSGAGDARWSDRSFVTLQEHSGTLMYTRDSNTRKYSCPAPQGRLKHSIRVTEDSRHQRARLAQTVLLRHCLSEAKKEEKFHFADDNRRRGARQEQCVVITFALLDTKHQR